LAPKHLHSGLKIIEVATYLAVCLFNEGNASILLVNELNIVVGNRSFSYTQEMDNRRVKRQNRRSALEIKEARKARKEELCKLKTNYMKKKKDCYMMLESLINQ